MSETSSKKKGSQTKETVPSVAKMLHKISRKQDINSKRQAQHELSDDVRFGSIDKTLMNQPTKNDLTTLHQEIINTTASKEDLGKLASHFFDVDGQPKFATKDDMQPILNLYRGSTFVKSLAAGVGTFFITLVAVGYALIQLVSWLRGH